MGSAADTGMSWLQWHYLLRPIKAILHTYDSYSMLVNNNTHVLVYYKVKKKKNNKSTYAASVI